MKTAILVILAVLPMAAQMKFVVNPATGKLQIVDVGVQGLPFSNTPTADGQVPTYVLSTGRVAWTLPPGSGGGTSGSGTANTLTKWITTSSIGNSLVSESGSTVTVNGILNLPATQSFTWATRGALSMPADGRLLVTDTAGTGFTRLMFGGTTASYPALARSTTELQAKLADDSAFAPIRASAFVVNGATGTNCLLANGTTAACGGSSAWGAITGTLSAQTDLQNALNAKLTASSNLSDVVDVSTARANLGLTIGSNVQAFDSDLSAIAALACSDTQIIKRAGGVWTCGTDDIGAGGGVTTVFGRSGTVVAAPGDYTATQVTNTPAGTIAASTVQAALNELDTEKQPASSELTAVAGVSSTGFVRRTGANTWSAAAISDADVPDAITIDNLTRLTTRNYSDLQNIPSTFSPSAHASSHRNGGSDEIATATPGANAIPKAGAGGTLAAGWIPDLSGVYQPLDADLTNLGSIAKTANYVIGANGAGNAWEPKQLVAGSNVTITHGAGSVTIAATGNTGYGTVADEGTPVTQRATVNFTGAGISCVDNAGQSRTDCTVSGAAGGGAAENTFLAGATSVTVTDNLGTTTKVVQCFIGTAPNYVQLLPNSVEVNSNTTVIGFTAASGDGKCVVSAGGSGSGGGSGVQYTTSTSDPSGACTPPAHHLNTSTQAYWVCTVSGTWKQFMLSDTTGTGVLSLLEGTAPGAGATAGLHNLYFDSADSRLKSHENAGSVVTYYSTANPQTTVTGNAGTATALASNPTDCSANQFANAIAANGNLTCSSIADADVPDTITASNYLPLAGGTLTGQLVTAATNISQRLDMSGDITPAQITATQNDYSPIGLSTSSVLRLSGDIAYQQLTGLSGGADGRIIVIYNVGTVPITLAHESTSSTAANRFTFSDSAPYYLRAGESLTLWYDATSSRWRPVGPIGSASSTASNSLVRRDVNGEVAINIASVSAGLSIPNSATLPGTCSVGQIYMDTDATSGQRIYACESTNTWVLQGGGGGGGMTDPMTTRGDTIYRNSSNVTARLPVGTGFLKADGTDVTGYATIATTDLPARTKRFSLLNGTVLPDTTGDVFSEPYTILATNDVWGFGTWRFGASNSAQPTVRSCLAGHFSLPSDLASTVSTANAVIVWSGTGTTGNVVWDFDYRIVGGNDTTSLDQSGTQEAVTVTDAMPGAANRRLVASVALTAGNFSGQADTSLEWKVCRDGADANDTAAFSALLKDVLLEVTVR